MHTHLCMCLNVPVHVSHSANTSLFIYVSLLACV